MIAKAYKDAILGMSPEELQELLEFVSERMAENVPPELSDAHQKLIDARLAAHEADPSEGEDWRAAVERLRKRST